MIVVDTSAFMAVVLDEDLAGNCSDILAREEEILLSAGTFAEALIVAGRRNVGEVVAALIEGLGCQVVPVTRRDAENVAGAYAIWGKGVHSAALNDGDCFAYALAKDRACPLQFVGDDFTRTDIPECIGHQP